MKKLTKISAALLLAGSASVMAGTSIKDHSDELVNIFTAVDMMENEVILINADNDVMIQQRLDVLDGWPGGRPQHTLISADGKFLYVTTDSSDTHSADIVVIKVKSYDWESGVADLKIKDILTAEEAGTASTYNVPTQVTEGQPIATWTQPPMTQLHGPTILPFSDYVYFTQWTDNKVRVVDTSTNTFADSDSLVIPGVTEQTHGIYFNDSGTLGLSTGYYYDDPDLDLFEADKETGELTLLKSIRLGDENSYAAFTHFNTWLDDRYVLAASMQFDRTSLTPEGVDIIPPSVWIVDAWEGTAEKILDMTTELDGNGVLRSASDLNVGAGKLIVAEEDSLDGTYGDDGFISLFDLSDRSNPTLIKRFTPGVELPSDYYVSHSISVSKDERFAYVASYASDYIVKIDLGLNEIVKTYGPEDGLTMPHGGYISGSNR